MSFDDSENVQDETAVRQLGQQFPGGAMNTGMQPVDTGAGPRVLQLGDSTTNWISRLGMSPGALAARGVLPGGQIIDPLGQNMNTGGEQQATKPLSEIGQRIVEIGAKQPMPLPLSRPDQVSGHPLVRLAGSGPEHQYDVLGRVIPSVNGFSPLQTGSSPGGHIVAQQSRTPPPSRSPGMRVPPAQPAQPRRSTARRTHAQRQAPPVHNLDEQLRRDEGYSHGPYRRPGDRWTIGYGHNLEAHHDRMPTQVSRQQADAMLQQDIQTANRQLDEQLPWASNLNDARRGALINMVFNMGIGTPGRRNGLVGFQRTLDMIRNGNYDGAAAEMLRSRWATQTGARATRLAEQIRTGQWQ
jgi:lysozyme